MSNLTSVGVTAGIPTLGTGTVSTIDAIAQIPFIVSANFTRPANTTAYASGDIVANNTTAGSCVPLSYTIASSVDYPVVITRARLITSSTSVTSAAFRAHVYNVTPTPVNGDNGVFSTDSAANEVGTLDIIVDQAFTDGARGIGTPNAGSAIITLPLSGAQTLKVYLEARGVYTPTSAGTFTLILEGYH